MDYQNMEITVIEQRHITKLMKKEYLSQFLEYMLTIPFTAEMTNSQTSLTRACKKSNQENDKWKRIIYLVKFSGVSINRAKKVTDLHQCNYILNDKSHPPEETFSNFRSRISLGLFIHVHKSHVPSQLHHRLAKNICKLVH